MKRKDKYKQDENEKCASNSFDESWISGRNKSNTRRQKKKKASDTMCVLRSAVSADELIYGIFGE